MDWKKLGRKILFPPIWCIALLLAVSIPLLILVFEKEWDAHPLASVVYVLSFYALLVLCMLCWKKIPLYYRKVKGIALRNTYINHYFTNIEFKTRVNLYQSFTINLIYVVINAVSAIVYETWWFAIFSVYYAIMAVMRYLLVGYVRKNKIGDSKLAEWKRSRACAFVLMTVNLALSSVVLMMVYHNRGFDYQGFLIYVMAMYTFYLTVSSIIEVVKYQRYNSPIMTLSKIIKLASALFSMLFLETAMFSQFGHATELAVQKKMIMATGGGIAVIVTVMAGYMIVAATREIKVVRSN